MDQAMNELDAIGASGNGGQKVFTEEQKARKYANIHKLMESTGCIIQYELKLYIYETIIKRLSKLGDYKDCLQLRAQYSKMVEDLKTEGQEKIYQDMCRKKEAVKSAEDIQWVLKEAKRIPDYKDTEDIVEWCDATYAQFEKKEQKSAMIRLVILVVVLVALGFLGKFLMGIIL